MDEFCKNLEANRLKRQHPVSEEKDPVRVLVTGAGGLVAYSVVYQLMSGSVLGENQPIILILLDIEAMLSVLKGVAMELNDCCSEVLRELIITTDLPTAFKDIDIALMMAATNVANLEPSSPEFLRAHLKIYKQHAEALNMYAKKTVKVIVVTKPSTTLAYICIRYAKSISGKNITSLMRLYQNRTVAQVGFKQKIPNKNIRNVILWGNSAFRIYPDLMHSSIRVGNEWKPTAQVIQNDHWIKNELVMLVQGRQAALATKRKISNALSTAKAIGDQMHDWWLGTREGEWVNMGVQSDGSYGIKEGLVFGFPVRIDDEKNYSIVQELVNSDSTQHRIDVIVKEGIKELDLALKICLELENMSQPMA